MTEGTRSSRQRVQARRSPRSAQGFRLLAVLAVAVAAGLVAWLLTAHDGSPHSGAGPGKTGPVGPVPTRKTVPVNVEGVRTLARGLEQPTYCARSKPGD